SWFYVGAHGTAFSDDPSFVATKLLLAVNRPHLDQRAAGDHAWSVNVTYLPFDPMHPESTCGPGQSRLASLRRQAPELCEALQEAIDTINGRTTAMEIAGGVAGALLIALITAAVAVLAADAARAAAAQQAQSTVLSAMIQDGVSHLGAASLQLAGMIAVP